jgi:hypothetical protein
MKTSIPANGDNPSRNGSSATSTNGINERAARSANPSLWLRTYNFYMSHKSRLNLSAEEAMQWADVDVNINADARQEFGLPPSQPTERGRQRVA